MGLQSHMLPLGTPVPDIALPDLLGERIPLPTYPEGRPLVIAFTCNHCPYVQLIERELGDVAREYGDIAFLAICSNDPVNYPDDDIPGLLVQVERAAWDFPYLVDADQQAAHALNAACTPDFFCFDATGHLAYRGAFDDARPRQDTPVTGSDLRAALQRIRLDEPVPEPHRPSMGCGIKWKAGNEPS